MNDIFPASPSNNSSETSPTAWLQGFTTILYAPSRIPHIAVLSPLRPILFGVLLWVVASVTTQFITASTPQLQKQQFQMQENDIRALGNSVGIHEEELEQQVQDFRAKMKESFSPTSTIAWALIYGLFSVFILGSLFWIFQRLFISEPPPYLSTIAIVAFGLAINSIGSIVITALQAVTGSIFASPSLAFLTAPIENTLSIFHTFLTKLNVFTVWEYIAVGIAVAAHAGLARKFGIIFGVVALLVVFGVFSVLALGYSLMVV